VSGSILSTDARGRSARADSDAARTSAAVHEPLELDLRGVLCPLNWVKTRLALERMPPGGELVVRLDPGEPLESVPRSAREDGHEAELLEHEGYVRIVRR
jgi:TusA-related sulfurtransferase